MTKIDYLPGKQKRFKVLPSAESIIARVGKCKSRDEDNEYGDFRAIHLRNVYHSDPSLTAQRNSFLAEKTKIELILESLNA